MKKETLEQIKAEIIDFEEKGLKKCYICRESTATFITKTHILVKYYYIYKVDDEEIELIFRASVNENTHEVSWVELDEENFVVCIEGDYDFNDKNISIREKIGNYENRLETYMKGIKDAVEQIIGIKNPNYSEDSFFELEYVNFQEIDDTIEKIEKSIKRDKKILSDGTSVVCYSRNLQQCLKIYHLFDFGKSCCKELCVVKEI